MIPNTQFLCKSAKPHYKATYDRHLVHSLSLNINDSAWLNPAFVNPEYPKMFIFKEIYEMGYKSTM